MQCILVLDVIVVPRGTLAGWRNLEITPQEKNYTNIIKQKQQKTIVTNPSIKVTLYRSLRSAVSTPLPSSDLDSKGLEQYWAS